jgi:hypothetical protein
MVKKVLIITLTYLLLISFSTSQPVLKDELDKLDVPPGTTKIGNNLYYDQTEVRNVDYLEFLNWTKRVFGENSENFKSIYPDTTLWGKLDTKYSNLDTAYLTHPQFRKLSVLGVSNDQAKKFSKWRSDRVMEFILIRDGVLKYKAPEKGEAIFTIETYFSGNYKNIKPDLNIIYYPEYRLLDSLENTKTGFKNYCVYKKWSIK